MEDSICLDTDILIDLLRNNSETISWIKENKNNFKLVTTIISVFELFAGAYKAVNLKRKLKDIRELIEKLEILNISLEIAEEAGRQKAILEEKGINLDIRDLFIGSIALSNNFPLKTNNKKHFSRIEGLKLA